jgi:hypothetical protein
MKQCLTCKEVMDLANHRRVAVTAGTKGLLLGAGAFRSATVVSTVSIPT